MAQREVLKNPSTLASLAIKFHVVPVISLSDQTCAYQSRKLEKTITRVKYNGLLNKLYCVPISDKTKQVSEETCIEFSKFTTWSSFESYLLHASRKLKTIQYNDKDWKLSKCSCWQWCWLFLNEKSFWITQYKQRMSRSGVVAWASNSVCLKD